LARERKGCLTSINQSSDRHRSGSTSQYSQLLWQKYQGVTLLNALVLRDDTLNSKLRKLAIRNH